MLRSRTVKIYISFFLSFCFGKREEGGNDTEKRRRIEQVTRRKRINSEKESKKTLEARTPEGNYVSTIPSDHLLLASFPILPTGLN